MWYFRFRLVFRSLHGLLNSGTIASNNSKLVEHAPHLFPLLTRGLTARFYFLMNWGIVLAFFIRKQTLFSLNFIILTKVVCVLYVFVHIGFRFFVWWVETREHNAIHIGNLDIAENGGETWLKIPNIERITSFVETRVDFWGYFHAITIISEFGMKDGPMLQSIDIYGICQLPYLCAIFSSPWLFCPKQPPQWHMGQVLILCTSMKTLLERVIRMWCKHSYLFESSNALFIFFTRVWLTV